MAHSFTGDHQYKSLPELSYHSEKMTFRLFFAGLVAVATVGSVSLSPSEIESYEMKLREYQNMTNIDEFTFNRIWTTGLSNSKSNEIFKVWSVEYFYDEVQFAKSTLVGIDESSMARQQGLTMARYSMTTSISGDHIPIRWNTREFNFGITYNNGIITITHPGYYRITGTCYSINQLPDYIECKTYVNGALYLDTTSTRAAPGFMHGIIRLDVFDTIYFSKHRSPAFPGGKYKNYFTIEKL